MTLDADHVKSCNNYQLSLNYHHHVYDELRTILNLDRTRRPHDCGRTEASPLESGRLIVICQPNRCVESVKD